MFNTIIGSEQGPILPGDSKSGKGVTSSSAGSKQPLDVAIIDDAGAQITSFGSLATSADYKSPSDFSVSYATTSTLTVSGLPFSLTSNAQIVYIKVVRTGNTSVAFVNGSGGYTMTYSAGTLTLYKGGVASASFAATDQYEVGINDGTKAYNEVTDSLQISALNPDSSRYVQDSLVDTTNIAAGTNYYPSATGMSMDGYADFSLSGKLIDADNTTTLTLEVTNDEDPSTADWVQVQGYNWNTNAVVASIAAASTTTTYAWDFENLNFTYIRAKVVTGGSTNTVIVKARRKAL